MFSERWTSFPFYFKQNPQPWAAATVRNHRDLVSPDDASFPPWVELAEPSCTSLRLPEQSEPAAATRARLKISRLHSQICSPTCCAVLKLTQQPKIKLVPVYLLQHRVRSEIWFWWKSIRPTPPSTPLKQSPRAYQQLVAPTLLPKWFSPLIHKYSSNVVVFGEL